MAARDFLFELGAEELPPKALPLLSQSLFDGILKGLADAGLAHGKARRFATPRRLAVLVEKLAEQQPPRKIERRGPPLAQAFDAQGAPAQSALAFARSCGVEVASLETQKTDKGAWLCYRAEAPGAATVALLPGIVAAALAALPIPKRMRWGARETEFVRPVHWIVMLFGDAVVPAQLLGLDADRITHGHRFHAPKPIRLKTPKSYERALERAQVVADFERRRALIETGARQLGASLALGGAHSGAHGAAASGAADIVAASGAAHSAGTSAGAPAPSDGSAADAAPAALRTLIDAALLDEVTALTEWPVPLAARFEERFLALPREVVISTVEHHQRYFPVVAADGALTPHFITISNIESRDPDQVRAGNERVVRPRLSDAAFFWDQDRKLPLAAHAERLASITYQAKLGSYADKTRRIAALAESIAARHGGTARDAGGAAQGGAAPGGAELTGTHGSDVSLVARAAQLAKADLLTAMVGEFPELQGTMGRYYALADGEDARVAAALEEQYLPRFSGDRLPQSGVGRALAVADRLDTLAGIFAIDQRPTGAKDPFGLRRAALGILRILFDARWDADLAALTREAVALQPVANPKAAQEVFDFLMERLRGLYLDEIGGLGDRLGGNGIGGNGISGEMFDAVAAAAPATVLDFDARLKAVREFWRLADAAQLAAANKRIVNILKKIPANAAASIDAALFADAAETALHGEIERIRPIVDAHAARGEYTQSLQRLTALRPAVDAFFDQVMVMDENLARRANRIALLAELKRMMSTVADLARLPAAG